MIKSKLYIIISVLLIFASIRLFAQEDDYSRQPGKTPKSRDDKSNKSSDHPNLSKIVIGGGIGMQFGTQTFIEVTPKVGYRFVPKALFGVGVLYRYYHYKDPVGIVIEGSDYGTSIFASYEPFTNFFGWTELEMLNYQPYINIPSRVWAVSPFIGAGYRQPVGDKGFIQLSLLYNLNYNSESPYSSPWVTRIGIFF